MCAVEQNHKKTSPEIPFTKVAIVGCWKPPPSLVVAAYEFRARESQSGELYLNLKNNLRKKIPKRVKLELNIYVCKQNENVL